MYYGIYINLLTVIKLFSAVYLITLPQKSSDWFYRFLKSPVSYSINKVLKNISHNNKVHYKARHFEYMMSFMHIE